MEKAAATYLIALLCSSELVTGEQNERLHNLHSQLRALDPEKAAEYNQQVEAGDTEILPQLQSAVATRKAKAKPRRN